jgi:hypothetical protein
MATAKAQYATVVGVDKELRERRGPYMEKAMTNHTPDEALSDLLFAVMQEVGNGCAPYSIEKAYEDYERSLFNHRPQGVFGDKSPDARLRDSAPELLEALQILAEHDFGTTGWTPLLESAAIKGRAAIKKATGE